MAKNFLSNAIKQIYARDRIKLKPTHPQVQSYAVLLIPSIIDWRIRFPVAILNIDDTKVFGNLIFEFSETSTNLI